MTQLDLHVDCEVPPEKLCILIRLLEEFLPDASIPNIEHLREIRIVPDASKDTIVNELKGSKPGAYVAGDVSNACAVPVQKNASLHCYILFGESFVHEIDPEQPYDAKIVLTIFEEMLHVRLYSTLWEQYGNLIPPSDLSCTTDLMILCTGFRDEYIVNRWKYAYFVAQAEKTGTLQPFSRSDFPLITRLDQAKGKLSGIVLAAATNQMSTGTAWVNLLRCVYRDIFELLARHAAPLAAISPENIKNYIDLSESQFYQNSIALYWQQIQTELERSFTSNLKEAHNALENMVKTMKAFLASIGVTYHKTASGDCYANFGYIG
jgi:hypothetical protein